MAERGVEMADLDPRAQFRHDGLRHVALHHPADIGKVVGVQRQKRHGRIVRKARRKQGLTGFFVGLGAFGGQC